MQARVAGFIGSVQLQIKIAEATSSSDEVTPGARGAGMLPMADVSVSEDTLGRENYPISDLHPGHHAPAPLPPSLHPG